jgi:hypothetical protein
MQQSGKAVGRSSEFSTGWGESQLVNQASRVIESPAQESGESPTQMEPGGTR